MHKVINNLANFLCRIHKGLQSTGTEFITGNTCFFLFLIAKNLGTMQTLIKEYLNTLRSGFYGTWENLCYYQLKFLWGNDHSSIFYFYFKKKTTQHVWHAQTHTQRGNVVWKSAVTVCTGYLSNVFSLKNVTTFIHEQRACDSWRATVGVSSLQLARGTGDWTQGLRFNDRHIDCLNHLVNLWHS